MAQPNSILFPGGTFDPEGHIYRDDAGQRILSVTQVFQLLGLVNYDDVQAEVLARKSALGIAVHRAVELLTAGELDWETVDDAAWNYVIGIERWMEDNQYESLSREQLGIHTIHGMRFGYQYDQRGTMLFCGSRRHVILDIKTAVREGPTWPIQLAGYEIPAPALNGESYIRVALHAQPEGPVKPLYYSSPEDRNTFLYMLYTAIWKLNHGFQLA